MTPNKDNLGTTPSSELDEQQFVALVNEAQIPVPHLAMEQSTAPPNQNGIDTTPLHVRDEQRFIKFVNVTRLDIAVPAVFIATFFFFAVGRVTHVLPAGSSFLVAYELIYFIVLFLVILPRRTLFIGLLRGDLNRRAMWLYGLAPLAILIPILALAVLIAYLTHEPIHNIESLSIYRRREIAAGLLAPFGEEIVFRVWLQTRLQQGIGKFGTLFGGARVRPWFNALGAILCALLFVANHVNGFSEWGIYALAAWLTWLRFRHRSLGATLISHFVWNAILGLFGMLVLMHVLK